MLRTTLALSISCALTTHALAQATPTLSDVSYGDGHPAQMLDIYIPPGLAPAQTRPCVVWIHGGGWQNGDKFPAPKVPALLGLGFVVVSINYRLSDVAPHPAQIHDCKGAIRHLRTNAAAYHINPSRIGVWGSSAGGHLTALIGTSGDKSDLEGTVGGNASGAGPVQAIVDYFGPADILSTTFATPLACDSPESRMLGVCLGDVIANQDDPAFADELAIVLEASPTTHVSANDPPFYIAHGTADPVVETAQSITMYSVLAAAGVESQLRLVLGGGHGFSLIEDVAARKFLAAKLGRPVCTADWNANGLVSNQDIFDFLAAYFAGVPSADVNSSGTITTQDIFEMLADFFGGCAG